MPFSDEDKKELGEIFAGLLASEQFGSAIGPLISKAASGAVTDHLKRAGVSKDSLGSLSTKLSELEEKFSKVPPAPTPGAAGDGTPQSAEMAEMKARLDAAMAEVQKQAEATKRETAARLQAEERAWNERAHNELKSHLSKVVRPEMLDDVTDLLKARGHITKSEEGAPLFKIRRSPGAGLPEEDTFMPLADGVGAWAKTKPAGVYVPAPGEKNHAGGSGPRGGRPPMQTPRYDKPATTDDEKIRRAMAAEQAARDRNPNL